MCLGVCTCEYETGSVLLDQCQSRNQSYLRLLCVLLHCQGVPGLIPCQSGWFPLGQPRGPLLHEELIPPLQPGEHLLGPLNNALKVTTFHGLLAEMNKELEIPRSSPKLSN